MVKLYLYDLRVEFINWSHLKNKNFFEVVEADVEADFLYISATAYKNFFLRISEEPLLRKKKIIFYNFTEPVSLGSAQFFYKACIETGVESKNIFFHSTNHFLDKFNCLHKGLSITDHIVKSQLDTGFINFDERFLKFCFINNTLRTPRALAINEVLNRKINFNQSYVSANGDFHYGDRNIQLYENIKDNIDALRSHDHTDVYYLTSVKSDKNFQSVYKNSFFNFTIETFSDFDMDADGVNSHLTEKTLRNFCHKIPFLLLISSEEQIRIIEDLGFVLFNDLFDFKIDATNRELTIKKYVDVIEKFSKMKSIDIKEFVKSEEIQKRIEHNYNQYLYYKNLDIENIYKYILSDEYLDKNGMLLEVKEREIDNSRHILASDI